MISGRRWQRHLEQSRWRWIVLHEEPNRHMRRGYLVQLRRAARSRVKTVVHPEFKVVPDEV